MTLQQFIQVITGNANIVMTPNLFSKENNININKPELKVGLNIPDIKLSQDNEFNPNKTLKEIKAFKVYWNKN